MRTFLRIFDRLHAIPETNPAFSPENWCRSQPCWTWVRGQKKIVITQPTSTFFVYALGLLTTCAGVHFCLQNAGQLSRYWWGASLLLWGVGALLAGTSYQAFAYHIKCSGRQVSSWTSWWEVIYLLLQQLSIDAMLVAVALSCTQGLLQDIVIATAAIIAVSYVVVTLYGAFIPIKSLITFERMVLISCPIYVFLLFLNGWRLFRYGQDSDMSYLITWFGLVIIMFFYWLYGRLGIANNLWKRGCWFSDNDVLHIGLILWVLYIDIALLPQVADALLAA